MTGIEIKGQLTQTGEIVVLLTIEDRAAVISEAGTLAIAQVLIEAVEGCRAMPGYKPSEGVQPLIVDRNTGNLLHFGTPSKPTLRQRLKGLFRGAKHGNPD